VNQAAKGELMISKNAKTVPLEYTPMGIPTARPSWTSLVPEEARNQAELLARIEHLEAERAALSEAIQQQTAAARAEAYKAASREQENDQSRRSALAQAALTRAIDEFSAGRDCYFAQVEREVVQLALAIASRVLHREAQMDPLLLSGAVKVALGQLSESTEVQLHIPSTEADLWTEMLGLMPNLPMRPAILPDGRLQAGECKLETHLGSVDIGVRAQLAEIERGFFDLLEHRGRVNDQRVTVPHAASA
jgi:flagellar assembly protein FliH